MNKVLCIKYTRCADLLVFYKLLTFGRNKKHHRNKDPKQLSMPLFLTQMDVKIIYTYKQR